ncbi:hypothetical protein MKJ04_03295 [Pontibacter sp. E15-1]|uniref:hypothetical protein n=1 Tax=Pontibacter sp. E15-1 TaxID=2919918 RepID=UPI001F4FF1FA|nr:hypothetical protein [Pontibacter sp. E15-1]MCJ8163852.1 hypothetical protein [Pontibacter sp. E15-1]
MAAILALCFVIVPTAQAGSQNTGCTITATVQQSAPGEAPAKKIKHVRATSTKPASKSVLDAEVLDSPFSYFKNAFFPEEKENGTASGPAAALITLKLLIATLLSTIM